MELVKKIGQDGWMSNNFMMKREANLSVLKFKKGFKLITPRAGIQVVSFIQTRQYHVFF